MSAHNSIQLQNMCICIFVHSNAQSLPNLKYKKSMWCLMLSV